MLFNSILTKLIKKGHLVWIQSNGIKSSFGDQSISPITIKTSSKFSNVKLLLNPEVYIGESYMNGDLEVVDNNIYEFLNLLFLNMGLEYNHWALKISKSITRLKSRFMQNNFIKRSKNNVAHHYDLSDKLYDLFLDKDRQYSCAYFHSDNDTLEQAQFNKKKLIAKKLLLEKNHNILDIGSGWGGMAHFLSEQFTTNVKGITLSEEQLTYSLKRKETNNLVNVEYVLQDYRNEKNLYDRIVSVGMFEHVGTPYYLDFFNKIYDLLNDKGVALIHTIGRYDRPGSTSPWIDKYIFPGGYIPALSEIMKNIEKSSLITTDVQILKFHYAETLKRWRYNFYDNIEKIRSLYDEKFCRMWDFYLSSSQASFESSNLVVFQLQLSKNKKTVPDNRDYLT